MQLHYWSHRLKFRYPFTISKGTKTHQPVLLVSLSLGKWTGFGEAPAISYYNISVEQMIADLEQKKSLVGMRARYGGMGLVWENEKPTLT
jgi:hypothetical protein